jgi:glycosyltransferase domain-containing protein
MREPDFVDACYVDKDLSLLKKLTLVIPTYNRNYYLSRCLWYHAHFPFGEIIVADSSPEEKKVVNRETVLKVREMFGANIRYLEYEPETDKYGGDIYRKWGDAVQHVETEYSQICTDKDFLIPTTLCHSVNFLGNNPTFIASMGSKYYIRSNTLSNGIENYYLFQLHPNCTSETSDNNLDRFVHSLLHIRAWHNHLAFATTNTKRLQYIYSLLDKYDVPDLRFGEVIISYTGHLFGKYNYTPSDMHIFRDTVLLYKERCKSGSFFCNSTESSTSRYPTFDDYEEEMVYSEFSEIYTNCTFDQIKMQSLLTEDSINRIITDILDLPLFHPYGKLSIIGIIENRYPSMVALWYSFPTPIKKAIGNIFLALFNISLPIKGNTIKTMNTSIEALIVARILLETRPLHDNDRPLQITR